ncbi:uncharacterized protein E5676_scaffold186G001430 [Cucumis melo var. makuwa]|uniref:Retrotransposon gag domain-containing protein n=1 Tax=Cucumis melo var. makuwa TaxID=1194695 RepID=A0A5D3CVQ0_CUCMM|nr:uncharacterized protein E5676_scaffold186G001430 [Cucumis melo var. makuwa]
MAWKTEIDSTKAKKIGSDGRLTCAGAERTLARLNGWLGDFAQARAWDLNFTSADGSDETNLVVTNGQRDSSIVGCVMSRAYLSKKTDKIDAVAGRVEGLPIQELLVRVDTLEANVGRIGNFEYGDSLSGFVAHMEGRVNELDSSQKTLLEMINDMSGDFRATLDVVWNEIVDVNIRLSLTMRAMANQVPVGGTVPVTKVKVPEPKPFCVVRDAKALENFIFDLEQYFKVTNTVTKEAKVTLTTMYVYEDAKLWWRSRYMDIQEGRCTIDTWDVLKKELRSQFFPENVEILA